MANILWSDKFLDTLDKGCIGPIQIAPLTN